MEIDYKEMKMFHGCIGVTLVEFEKELKKNNVYGARQAFYLVERERLQEMKKKLEEQLQRLEWKA